MRSRRRWVAGLAGALVLAFGLACLNYTKIGAADRHREKALQRGWPPPSQAIHYGGVLSAVLGAGLVGSVLGGAFRCRSA
jgi:hypothetical protein